MPKKKKTKGSAKPGSSSQHQQQPQHASHSHHHSSTARPSSSDQHASSASLRLSRDRRDAAESSRSADKSRSSADRRSADRRAAADAPSAAHASSSADRRSADRRSADKRTDADQLASSMQTLSLSRRTALSSSAAHRAMRRPGFGSVGQPINLLANFFPMRVPSDLRVYVHAVMIKRQIFYVESHGGIKRARRNAPGALRGWVDVSKDEPISYNRNIFDTFLSAEGGRLRSALAYDGRSIAYSAKKIDLQYLNTDFNYVVTDEGRRVPPNANDSVQRETVKVHVQSSSATLNFADYFNPNQTGLNREPFQAALDVALANGPARTNVMVGRSFYSPYNAKPLSNSRHVTGMAWRGFYQSVRNNQSGLMVNLDQSFTAFWNHGGKPLYDLVLAANQGREPSCRDARSLRNLSQQLKMLKVRAAHTGITCKVHGFADRGADDQRFDCDGRMVSVKEYFQDKYGIALQYPRLPLVKVKRDTYVPMEMLYVVDKQRMTGLLQPEQTREIVRVASTRPAERMQAASSKMSEILRIEDPVRDSFNIDVKPNLVRLKGRVLAPPHIQYNPMAPPDSQTAQPQGGSWRAPEKGAFINPVKLTMWALLNNSRASRREVEGFLIDFFKAARRCGVTLPQPVIVDVNHEAISSMMQRVDAGLKTPDGKRIKPQLMMIIQGRQDAAEYNEIKRVGDLKIGIATQVLLEKNITNPKRRDMFCDNVFLKVNSKLGGRNSSVCPFKMMRLPGMKDPAFVERPHIVLGADVTHPMPGGKTCSVAALVGSRDKEGIQFSASIRNQPARVEIIQELGAMFKEVYGAWRNNFKGKVHTQAIVMFRDGVADGQYEQVLGRELASLRQACETLGIRPRITYIIVTKRHHARFFSEDRRMQDRSGNIPPGTVVDHTVTSADYYEFYLNSHAGIQGTSKPSKYVVLLDENNMSVDELQGYVFRLSHGFARCNRSVSMVNSAYYAHLLAFRGRAYLQEGSDTASNQTNVSEVERTAVIPEQLQNRLYFV